MDVRTLKEWREARSLTVRALAETAHVATRTITLTEGGHREPTMRTWRKLCEVLEVQPDQIVEFRKAMGLK